jgi:chromosome segregation ATPase
LHDTNHKLQADLASNKAANDKLNHEIRILFDEIGSYKNTVLIMQTDMKSLKLELKETQRKYSDVQNSLSWKVGSALIGKPAGAIKRLVKK